MAVRRCALADDDFGSLSFSFAIDILSSDSSPHCWFSIGRGQRWLTTPRSFPKINPAAWLFSVLFLIQAGLLAWYGLIRPRLQFSYASSIRHLFSWGLVAYALVYPGLVWAEGNAFPRLPTFGVPCPTTILTIGFLLAANHSLPPVVTFIPILWALIGGSAAFLFGVHADLVLLAAGIGLLVYIIRVKCF